MEGTRRMNILRTALFSGALCLPVLCSQPLSAQQADPSSSDRVGKPDPGTDRVRGSRKQSGRSKSAKDPLGGRVAVGSSVPGFTQLQAVRPDGSEVALADLVPDEGHLVIVTGCLTCPKFLISHREVEAIAHDYRSSEHPVAFVYLYKSLAHPENGGWIQPFTIEERLAQVRAAAVELQTKIPFVCDPMDNRISSALGGSPNSAYVLHSDGVIDYVSGWADGPSLRTELTSIVGATEEISTADQIGVPAFTRPYRNTGTVVPRVDVPGTMTALQTRTGESKEPFYVKLRVEADSQALRGRPGKLYVGFHLDPVHDVHWNNLVDPPVFTITAPEGVEISPTTGSGPKVEVATDSDPREFLLDVAAWPAGSELTFDVRYFACSDKEGWCKPIEQSYVVRLERDRSAGMASGRWDRPGEQRTRGAKGRPDDASTLARMDADGDGRIARTEAPGRLQDRFGMFDTDGDGFISGPELERLQQRMSERPRGGEGRGGRGGRGGGRGSG